MNHIQHKAIEARESNSSSARSEFPYFKPRPFSHSSQIKYIQEPQDLAAFDYFIEGHNVAVVSGVRVVRKNGCDSWFVSPDFFDDAKKVTERLPLRMLEILLPSASDPNLPLIVGVLLLSSRCDRQIARASGNEHFIFRSLESPDWQLECVTRSRRKESRPLGEYSASGFPSLIEYLIATEVIEEGNVSDSSALLPVRTASEELQILQRIGASTFLSRKLHQVYYSRRQVAGKRGIHIAETA
jgi:hypothetical protein